MKYFIYRYEAADDDGIMFAERRYYRKKQRGCHDDLEFVGTADLKPKYFITGACTKYTEIIDLEDVSLVFKAVIGGQHGRIKEFELTFQDMLRRAKEDILPYISFAQHKVSKKPVLKINGKRHGINDELNLVLYEY